MGLEENVALVQKYWEKCWNLHDPDYLAETHHLTFSENGVVTGVSAFRNDLSAFFQSFPDVQVSIEDVLAHEDRVLMRVVYQGTHKGRQKGFPASGKEILVSGLELFLIMDGRIVHHWHEMDHLGMLTQIGYLPMGEKG
jgi:steroid delta-isomerase-like uncharacterized protein